MARQRIFARLVLCGALWAQGPGTVWAEDHAARAPAPPDAHALGITERLLKYCNGVDPSGAEKLREKIKRLAAHASEQTLARIRRSDEYRKAYVSMDEFVAKIDEHNAKRACSGSFVAGR